MRGYLVLVVLGVLALVSGVGLVAAATVPQTTTTTFSLPAGNICTRFQFDVITGGSVTVTFQATSGAVDQYMMTEAQHTAFTSGGGLSYLAADTGSSGTFSASLPSGGTYFVESCHASGYESTDQTGSHTITVDAIGAGSFYGGVGALVVGAVLLGIGLWLRTRPARPVPPPYPAYSPYPYGPGPAYGGAAGYPPQAPVPGWPPAVPMAVLHTIHVRVENATATDEAVQILVNGAPALTLPVPAGKTSEMSVHTNVTVPPGTPVRVEAVSGAGMRAAQDVVTDATGSATVSLRIG